MTPKGLLVVSPQGQEFLLVPEEQPPIQGYTLSILQRNDREWVRLTPLAAQQLRAGMLGGLLEFFGNLCRILNQAPEGVALSHRSPSQNTLHPAPRRRRGRTGGTIASTPTINPHTV